MMTTCICHRTCRFSSSYGDWDLDIIIQCVSFPDLTKRMTYSSEQHSGSVKNVTEKAILLASLMSQIR